MIFLAALISLLGGFLLGCKYMALQIEEEIIMTKATLLKALALIAQMQALEASDRAANATLQNQVAQFREDHDLVNDAEVNEALGAVLRAAETAPVSADATHAAEVTDVHLAPVSDDTKNAANGASGNSGVGEGAADSETGSTEAAGAEGTNSEGSQEGSPSPAGEQGAGAA